MCLPIPLEAGRLTLGRSYTYITKSRLAISFDEVVDRERKHPGEEASGHLGASEKEASGIRGSRAPEGRVARAFLILLIVLDRLALGPGPIEALGLGRLARGTEPMVPTESAMMIPIPMAFVNVCQDLNLASLNTGNC